MNLQRSGNDEAKLDAKSRFGLLCESLPVGLLIVGRDGTIFFTNRKTARMFGTASRDCVGRNLLDLFKSRYNNAADNQFGEFLTEVQNRGGTIELDTLGGPSGSFPVELSVSEFPVENDSALLATVMDITERREFQKLKQELIAMVSHDMATPLASVQLSLEFIASKTAAQLTDGDLVLAKKAEKSVAHLIKLVNDLLTVERLESGKIDLVFDEFELLPMLKDAAEILQEFAHSKQVEIKVQFTDQVLTADQDRLKQVVMNFLTNAIKFSPPQGQITVSAVGENTGVKVMVTDQGRGVPKAEQRLIFERFHQVDRSDAREKGGRGLGLAICKALIEGHGGSIGVTSDPPHGSTFWFVVPNIQN